MSVQIGDVVELDRQSGGRYPAGRYVVAQFMGATGRTNQAPSGEVFAKLVTKNANGTTTSFVRDADGLTPVAIEPFEMGESVRVNTMLDRGTFLTVENGIARVLIPAWAKELMGGGKVAHQSSVARVPLWQLVLENRL